MRPPVRVAVPVTLAAPWTSEAAAAPVSVNAYVDPDSVTWLADSRAAKAARGSVAADGPTAVDAVHPVFGADRTTVLEPRRISSTYCAPIWAVSWRLLGTANSPLIWVC